MLHRSAGRQAAGGTRIGFKDFAAAVSAWASFCATWLVRSARFHWWVHCRRKRRSRIDTRRRAQQLKTQVGKLGQLAVSSVSLAGRGVSAAAQAASNLAVTATAAGKTAQKAVDAAMDHQTTKAAVFKAKEMAATAKVEAGEMATSATSRALDLAKTTANGAKKLSGHMVATARKVDENHQQIAAKTDTVSMGLGIVAGVAVAGAKLTAIPLVVAASPAIGGVAAVVGVIAGSAHFYSKWKTKKAKSQAIDGE